MKFRKPCLLSSPSTGFCRNEECYDYCVNDKNIKNNWMCWRDGVLETEGDPRFHSYTPEPIS